MNLNQMLVMVVVLVALFFILQFNFNLVKLPETFSSKGTEQCIGPDQGLCIDEFGNEECVPGNSVGPSNKEHSVKCETWKYQGNCMYGYDCPFSEAQHVHPDDRFYFPERVKVPNSYYKDQMTSHMETGNPDMNYHLVVGDSNHDFLHV